MSRAQAKAMARTVKRQRPRATLYAGGAVDPTGALLASVLRGVPTAQVARQAGVSWSTAARAKAGTGKWPRNMTVDALLAVGGCYRNVNGRVERLTPVARRVREMIRRLEEDHG